MSRYHWDKTDLTKAVNKVQRLLDKETDPKKIAYYGKVIDAVNKYIFLKFADIDYKRPGFNEKLVDTAAAQLGYSRYITVIGDIYEEMGIIHEDLNYVGDIEKRLYRRNPELFIPKYYTHDQTLGLVKEFYSGFDKELYDIFTELYKKRYRTINFSKHSYKRDLFNSNTNCGYCINVGGVNEMFMSIDNFKGICKVANTVHEYGHAIKNILVPEKTYGYYPDFIGEVESIFPEFVFYHEMGKKIAPLDSALDVFDATMTYYNQASQIILQKAIIDTWIRNKYVFDQSVKDTLLDTFYINMQEVRTSIDTEVCDAGPYVISFGIVLELFNLYKRDKKKALELYKKIITAPYNEEPMDTMLRFEKELNGFKSLSTELSIMSYNTQELLLRKK